MLFAATSRLPGLGSASTGSDRHWSKVYGVPSVEDMNTLCLNNGVMMPALGLGVFQTPPDKTRAAVESAIGTGYRHRDCNHGSTLEDPVIVGIAGARGKSPAQVMLRWHLQHGRSVIPKSTKPHRIAENLDVFDFNLSGDEVAAINNLDTDQRGGPEPDAITLESFGREIPEA
jgi:diketogulonate reductase-like aldo/keto reductase